MTSEVIIDVTPRDISIALLEDKRLVEFQREGKTENFAVGNIYLAKVRKLMPGLNACFVNVGYERDAFLHYLDLGTHYHKLDKYLQLLGDGRRNVALDHLGKCDELEKDGSIANTLKVGQELLVQIVKEPINTKGPRLTSELSFAGRFLVLMPFCDKVSVSSKIKSGAERNRLKQLIQSIKPKGFGVIIRTVAEGKRVAELDQELRILLERWEHVVEQIKKVRQGKAKLPNLAYEETSRSVALLRDLFNPSYENIYVNDTRVFNEVKSEALNVVDVNSGNRSKSAEGQEVNALDVNLGAADEIARQLRLRDMGGIVVVDFIDMNIPENRQKLYERMVENMKQDRARHNILPLSKFGLMQITRQRVRPAMSVNVEETCPTCSGTGKIRSSLLFTDTLESKINEMVNKLHIKRFTLYVHPFVAAYINQGVLSMRRRWQLKYGFGVRVMADQQLAYLQYTFRDHNGEEISMEAENDMK